MVFVNRFFLSKIGFRHLDHKQKEMRKFILKTVSALMIINYIGLPICVANEIQQTLNQNKNIEGFIKVWGIVKYRSPNSVAGKFDADKFFLANIEAVKNANLKAYNEILLKIVDAGGVSEIQKNVTPNCGECLTRNVNYKWINNQQYSKQLRSKLIALSKVINPTEEHHYINKVNYETEIKNEAGNSTYNTFTDQSIHLLALAKSWCAIEYLFPYKYQMDKNSIQILKEMIPLFSKINSRASYEKAILTLETNIHDTHAANFLNQLKSKAEIFKISHYPPFDYQCSVDGIVIKSFLNDSLAQASLLKKGDVIVEINNIKIKDWLNERMELLPASNRSVKYRLLSSDWKGNAYAFYNSTANVLAVKVRREGKILSLNLNMLNLRDGEAINMINQYIRKNVVLDEAVKPLENIGNDIAVIRGGYYLDKYLPKSEAEEIKFSKELQSKKALIFDMRDYPSGGLFYYFIPMALGKTSFEFAKYYKANIKDPSTFSRVEGKELYLSKDLKEDKKLYQGKIVILTNEHTQSKGEWFTMMLSQLNNNTTIIGSQTAGADGDLKELNLPGGYKFIFTGNGIFYPNGKETQRIGIKPDILFKPTVADLSSKADAHLARAVKFINEGK